MHPQLKILFDSYATIHSAQVLNPVLNKRVFLFKKGIFLMSAIEDENPEV